MSEISQSHREELDTGGEIRALSIYGWDQPADVIERGELVSRAGKRARLLIEIDGPIIEALSGGADSPTFAEVGIALASVVETSLDNYRSSRPGQIDG